MSTTTKFNIRAIALAIVTTLNTKGPVDRQEALGLIATQATNENPDKKVYTKGNVTNPYNEARKTLGDTFKAVVKVKAEPKVKVAAKTKDSGELPAGTLKELEDRIEDSGKDKWAIINKKTREVVGYASSRKVGNETKTTEQVVVKTETLNA